MKKNDAFMMVRAQEIENNDRKKYLPPLLKIYGNIAQLTMGGANSTRSDHGSNHMRP